MYYFALMANFLEDTRERRIFNKQETLESLFTELVNGKGYSYEEKFIESSTEWMNFILKYDSTYKAFFAKLADRIENQTKQQNFKQLLEQ